MIKTVKIYPPIGIARLGNSKDGYFIGPEKLDEVVAPTGGMRDATGMMKRQAARFRLFGYDEHNALVGEVKVATPFRISSCWGHFSPCQGRAVFWRGFANP